MTHLKLRKLIEEFTKNGINTDSTNERFKYVLEFQDVIGRGSMNDLLDDFATMDKNERGNFLWSACTCLDKDTFLSIIKNVVCHAVIIEEETRLNDMYADRLADLKIREKNITRLEQDNAINVERIRTLELDLEYKIKEKNSLQKKAESFDTIKRLLIA